MPIKKNKVITFRALIEGVVECECKNLENHKQFMDVSPHAAEYGLFFQCPECLSQIRPLCATMSDFRLGTPPYPMGAPESARKLQDKKKSESLGHCDQCRYATEGGRDEFICHRYPPPSRRTAVRYVSSYDWCGEFEERE